MASHWMFTMFALVCAFASISCREHSEVEKEVVEYLEKKQTSYKNIMGQQATQTWSDVVKESPEAFFMTLLKQIIILEEIGKKLKTYSTDSFEDKELKRQAHILIDNINYLALEERDLVDFMMSGIGLAGLTRAPSICEPNSGWGGGNTCSLSFFPDVAKRISETSSVDDLKHYWKDSRDKFGQGAREKLVKIKELMEKAAEMHDVYTPSKFYYEKYGMDMIGPLEGVVEDFTNFYKELHAFVRHQLNLEHGEYVVPRNGRIPQYLIQQLIYDSSRPDAHIQFPIQHDLPTNLTAKLFHKFYTNSTKMLNAAENFYTSLGFPNLPTDFYEKNSKPQEEESGNFCKSQVVQYLDPVAGYKYCPGSSLKTFLQMHQDMANIYYDAVSRKQKMGFDEEAAPGFGNAIGQAVALSVLAPGHFSKIDIGRDEIISPDANINRLYRLALYFMLSIPQQFAEEKFFAEMLDGEVQPQQYNCRYWEHMSTFAGVSPSERRDESTMDLSPEFYDDILGSGTTKALFSQLLGFQLYKRLCEFAGEYSEHDEFTELNRCDFYGKKPIGFILKPILSEGKSTDWTELLESFTYDDALKSNGFLEYFDPLYKWLKTENERHGVQVGWDAPRSCYEP